MKILYLYYIMKLNGPDYHRARKLTEQLEEHHRLDLKYMILADDDYSAWNKADPGFPELISASDFLNGGYNCVIVDDRLYENNRVGYRIPPEVLQSFHEAGGIVTFFFGDQDIIRNGQLTSRDLGTYLGRCNHGHGGLFSSDSSANIILGVQRGDSHLQIDITEDYLNSISPGVREVYDGVRRIVADWAFHLHPGSELLLVGDRTTGMVTDLDLYWDGPRPLIFGNMSQFVGTTVFITGHIWKDYIIERYDSDNLRFLNNLLTHCAQTQKQMAYHQHRPLVFLSYSHRDTAFVDRLVPALERRGIEVWRDVKQIRGGQSITKRVEDGLRKADYYLLVLSTNSLGSPWVDLEYRTALNMSISLKKTEWIIPVVTDVSNEQLLQFSLILSDRKYIRFGLDFRAAVKELVQAMQ